MAGDEELIEGEGEETFDEEIAEAFEEDAPTEEEAEIVETKAKPKTKLVAKAAPAKQVAKPATKPVAKTAAKPAVQEQPQVKGKRHMSAAAKAKVSAALKAKWAERKAKQGKVAAVPVAKAAKAVATASNGNPPGSITAGFAQLLQTVDGLEQIIEGLAERLSPLSPGASNVKYPKPPKKSTLSSALYYSVEKLQAIRGRIDDLSGNLEL